MPTRERQDREALLDEMLADSFPASDAPSFTPVTGVGGGESAEPGAEPPADNAVPRAIAATGDSAAPLLADDSA